MLDAPARPLPFAAAILLLTSVVTLAPAASASTDTLVHWTDWTSGSASAGYTAHGNITTDTATVVVTYHNPQGISFAQFSAGTDYWQNQGGGRDPATSPYTSAAVSNIPTGTDILALRFAGPQTLHFSQPIANPVFSYVSLNGNGYAFDRDFEILSFGHPSDGNACGFWGCGTSTKQVVTLPNGSVEYRLLGTGEPHGTIRFLGTFSSVSWRSLSNEHWNGFTVGVFGTEAEVFCEGVTDPDTTDTDADGVRDPCDVCPAVSDPLQLDGDADGLGDACDPCVGPDTDTDGDGLHDACEADDDNDGLNDEDEGTRGTDPLVADTDDDGLTDGDEAARGTDPLDEDTDDDGLSDGDDVALGTDPLDADSDDDGLSDGDEFADGTGPLDPDSDDDGLGDGDEVARGTDPLDADSDDDGLSDGDEVARGTDPLDADGDRDCYGDRAEVDGGSDPADPASIPTLAGPVALPLALTGEHGPVPCLPHQAPEIGA